MINIEDVRAVTIRSIECRLSAKWVDHVDNEILMAAGKGEHTVRVSLPTIEEARLLAEYYTLGDYHVNYFNGRDVCIYW